VCISAHVKQKEVQQLMVTKRYLSVSKFNRFNSYLLEKVDHLKLVFLPWHLRLDFRVRIVDDRQEHVQKNEEREEDKEDKVGGAKDAVCLLQLRELEIAEQYAKLSKSANDSSITQFNDWQIGVWWHFQHKQTTVYCAFEKCEWNWKSGINEKVDNVMCSEYI